MREDALQTAVEVVQIVRGGIKEQIRFGLLLAARLHGPLDARHHALNLGHILPHAAGEDDVAPGHRGTPSAAMTRSNEALQAPTSTRLTGISGSRSIARPSEATLTAARAAWLAARAPYQQTEVYRFGNAIVDDWEGRVNAWPLDEGLIDYVDASYGTEFDTNASITTILGTLKTAQDTLRSDASSFGSNLSIVQTRQDFTKALINTLQTGASNLTLADSNEEAANLLALQTRQSLSTKALSLASQGDQNVLRLLQ